MLVLIFNLGEERYGLEARQVVEIVPLIQLRTIPKTPDYISGVFQYRGRMVPVVDLQRLVRQQSCVPRLSTRLILVNYPESPEAGMASNILGLMAEKVTEAVTLKDESFQSSNLVVGEAPYLGRIATDTHGMIQMLKLKRILPKALHESLFLSNPA
jgi:chemotaxis-related protein WspB